MIAQKVREKYASAEPFITNMLDNSILVLICYSKESIPFVPQVTHAPQFRLSSWSPSLATIICLIIQLSFRTRSCIYSSILTVKYSSPIAFSTFCKRYKFSTLEDHDFTSYRFHVVQPIIMFSSNNSR